LPVQQPGIDSKRGVRRLFFQAFSGKFAVDQKILAKPAAAHYPWCRLAV
jgi:hypothetical protein